MLSSGRVCSDELYQEKYKTTFRLNLSNAMKLGSRRTVHREKRERPGGGNGSVPWDLVGYGWGWHTHSGGRAHRMPQGPEAQ